MANIREKLDLVTKLEALQSLLDENHSSNGIIKKYINGFKFRNDVDTRTMVGNMLREFKAYDWIQAVTEFCAEVNESVNENEIALALESTLFRLKFDNRFNSYNKAIEVLEGLIAEDTTDADKIFVALQESTWVPAIKNLFALVESKVNAPTTGNPDVNVSKVYSPVDVIEEGDSESYLFFANGRVYEMNDEGIEVSSKQPSAMFAKLLAVCEAFDVVDNKLKMTHKKHSIEIVLGESTEFWLDGRKIEENAIESTLSATGSFYINEMHKLELINFAAKNANQIQELDFATSISSNLYEGVVSNIFKLDESVYVNNVNPAMMENKFVKAENGNEAVTMVKEFVNYDASNFVKDILEGEEKFAQQIAESKGLIEERIEFLNEQLSSIVDAESELGSSEELKQAKDIIKESLDAEKDNLAKLLQK